MMQIFLSPPHLCGKEKEFIEEAIQTNWITTAGSNIEAFQQELNNFLDSEVHSLALNSCTSALHLALILANVNRGDEVICQSLTFAASANVILYQGATPVFIDSEKETWNICSEQLERAIIDRIAKGNKPKAIIVTDLFGMPANYDKISAVAQKYEITLIEDAAEALGAAYKGKKCGTLGDLGTISFNGNKIITTSGGGALVAKYADDFAEARFLAAQAKEPLPYYEHKKLGFNYAMSNISAGIGRGQMTVLEERIDKRRATNLYYRTKLAPFNLTFQTEPSSDYSSNFWLTTFLLDNGDPQQVIDYLARHQIEARRAMKPMHLQPLYENAPYYGDRVAEDIFNRGICLPSGSALTKEELDFIVEKVSDGIKSI
jgi:Predicted pyridoxal phosphate-dependent enzyme apparently involved in regulation of cell wall biogenesis